MTARQRAIRAAKRIDADMPVLGWILILIAVAAGLARLWGF